MPSLTTDTEEHMAHQHEYVTDTRPGWDGVYCRICGFHVPQLLVHLRAIQDRMVK